MEWVSGILLTVLLLPIAAILGIGLLLFVLVVIAKVIKALKK
jgi:hypothetical protein